MKKTLWMLLALMMTLTVGTLAAPQTAQAEEVQFELLGKLGGTGDFLGNESLGDPIFNVSGGLQITALFRFDMGVGVGLDFNWTMAAHRLGQTKLTTTLESREREMVVQHPSIGLTLRYEYNNLLDLGLWMNYGFGSVKNTYNKGFNSIAAEAFGITTNELEWDLQTFELGLMCAFMYKITKINLDVIIGLQGYVDFSRMISDAEYMTTIRDMDNEHMDENSLYSLGFNLVFGARYDLLFGDKKKKRAATAMAEPFPEFE
ncbi:MAG: hypothetical protein IKY83_07355 [Proteobacteria bacterium]|nr:hypothetical protein [Pseudomonadota bacterium]